MAHDGETPGIERAAAGGSNLTHRVTDAAGAVVALRRPPVGLALATAHDVDREWRIISTLHAENAVPGAQVAIHTLDLAEVGLADMGRHDGYVHRQLKRWMSQVQRGAVRDTTLIEQLHGTLTAVVPPEWAPPALAHGDYRFDNVVLTDEFSMAAVLDRELCTTGDPIADFVWSLQYWVEPNDDTISWLPDPPTTADSFPRRYEVTERYANATGFDLSDLPFYEAFSWWKQACIVEGVLARRHAGSHGGIGASGPMSVIAERVDAMLDRARVLLARLE